MTIQSLNYRLTIQEARVHKLYCYLKENTGGTEIDPVFSSSPSFTITQQDIDNWNSNTSVPNLQQVTNEGNSITNSIISTSSIQGNTIEINSEGFIGAIDTSLLSEGRNYSLPNSSGIFALLSDIPSESDTLASVTTRNPVTTNSITVGGLVIPTLLTGDSSYTKSIVAKPDGTFGWEDKLSLSTIGGILPSIKILDYSQDATNYILRVAYTYGQGSYVNPLFEVRIHSAGVIAQDTTIQQDSINQSSFTSGNITKTGFVASILIPKATNTSPAWNNDIVGLMITLLGVDNADGGASSTKVVRRIVSDMDLIGNIRPKLRDNYEKFTQIRDVTYTNDTTNYYINGRLDVAVQANFANNNSFTLHKFYLGTTEITGTGITVTNTAPGNFLTSTPVNDINGNPTTLGFTSIPFRITIPKATNASTLYNNNANGLLSFVFQYSSFGGATHVPIYIPYTIPALFTSPSAIQATTINASSLPNAQGDATYIRNLVQKTDGTIGYEPKQVQTTATATMSPAPDVSGYLNLRKTNNLVELAGSIVINDTYNMNNPFATLPAGYGMASNTFTDTLVLHVLVSNMGVGAGVYRAGTVFLSANNLFFMEPVPTGGVSIELYQQYTVIT